VTQLAHLLCNLAQLLPMWCFWIACCCLTNGYMCLQVIKRFIMHAKKTAFIVEHDFIMATYLADRVIVYDGEPSRRATARKPQGLLTGMNAFLKTLDITFRRDPTNYRPRINKAESTKDREQKLAGTFYYLDD